MIILFSPKIGQHSLYRRLSACFLLTVSLLALSSYSNSASNTSTEPELRAAVIVGILRFTTWPESSESNESSKTLVICLAGKPLSAKALLTLSGKHLIKGNEIRVKNISTHQEVQQCQTLVYGKGIQQKLLVNMVEFVSQNPIISLCDGCDNMDDSHATVNLIRNNQHIHFNVDWVQAKKNGILFDPSLLELASNQRRETR